MRSTSLRRTTRWALAAVVTAPMMMALTGCQVELAGQTLPSPWYLKDDFQYYAPASEFKLAREAADMQAQAAALESEAAQQFMASLPTVESLMPPVEVDSLNVPQLTDGR